MGVPRELFYGCSAADCPACVIVPTPARKLHHCLETGTRKMINRHVTLYDGSVSREPECFSCPRSWDHVPRTDHAEEDCFSVRELMVGFLSDSCAKIPLTDFILHRPA